MIPHIDNLKPGPIPISIADRAFTHILEDADVSAIRTALFTERPLLLLGEPGTGKSQLALAAATALVRAYRSITVSSKTEANDILWNYDAVRRLGAAQRIGALKGEEAKAAFKDLDEAKFVTPGPLWWGFSPSTASDHLREHLSDEAIPDDLERGLTNGVVVLIDEIDKAESDVPNGLLEAFGSGEISVPCYSRSIQMTQRPLVIITSNDERPVPAPFLRRCVVHELRLPDDSSLTTYLVSRGKAHFPTASSEVLTTAAEILIEDRDAARNMFPRPGLAEYVDLLRAAVVGGAEMEREPLDLLNEARSFVMHKHSKLKNRDRR